MISDELDGPSPSEVFVFHFGLAIRIAEHESSHSKALSERCQAQITDWQAFAAAQTVILQILLIGIDCKIGDGMAAKMLDQIKRHPPTKVN